MHISNSEISYENARKEAISCLCEAGITDYEIDAGYLMEYVTGMNYAGYFLHKNDSMPIEQYEKYREVVQKRKMRIPLQHITGEQEFMGLMFRVSSDVLVPRQDTETLVEHVLPYVKGKSVLDMCTGSGCIAVSLKKLGDAAVCEAADLSEKALKIASYNIAHNNVEVTLIQSDMFENIHKKYDMIVSNPPYIPKKVIEELEPEVKEHEPYMALEGGDDGLSFYRILSKEAKNYLRESGRLVMEIGYDQAQAVTDLLIQEGYQNVEVIKDLSGNDRVVSAEI